MPEDLATGTEDWYATQCGICNEHHGIIVRVLEGRAKKIEGNPDHPTNRGRLLPTCLSGVQSLYHPDRITNPIAGTTSLSWDDGMQRVVDAFNSNNSKRTLLITGADTTLLSHVVDEFVDASGIEHMVLEDLEDTVLRNVVSDIFGEEGIPHFDIQNAKTVLSIGADFLESWVAPLQYSRAYGEFRSSESGGTGVRGHLIYAGPRFSMTAANADQWLPIAPGQESNFALSVAYVLIRDNLADASVVDKITGGRGAIALAAFSPETIAPLIGATEGVISAKDIENVAKRLAEESPGLVLAGGSASAQQNGNFNIKASLLINALLGNIGKQGGIQWTADSPLRELNNFKAPNTFADWKSVTQRMDQGEFDLVLIHGANPVHNLEVLDFKDKLSKVGSVISFSPIMDESAELANLVLPDQNYLETWNIGVPNPSPGYPVLTLQQPVVPSLLNEANEIVYDNRPFGDILTHVGRELGYKSIAWENMEDLVKTKMSEVHRRNRGRGSIQGATFEAFWAGVLQRGGWWDTKAQQANPGPVLASLSDSELTVQNSPTEAEDSGVYHLVPFVSVGLGSGSQSYLPWPQSTPDPVTSVVWETWVEVNAREAKRLGLRDGDIVNVESVTTGEESSVIQAPVYIHPGIPPNVVGIPMGRGHTASGRYAKDFGSNVRKLLSISEVEGTGAQAWGVSKVTISGTGQRLRLPRMEGGITGMQLEGTQIIQVTGS
jgi:anaerobic selenocysteine-containing dehydrogenase